MEEKINITIEEARLLLSPIEQFVEEYNHNEEEYRVLHTKLYNFIAASKKR